MAFIVISNQIAGTAHFAPPQIYKFKALFLSGAIHEFIKSKIFEYSNQGYSLVDGDSTWKLCNAAIDKLTENAPGVEPDEVEYWKTVVTFNLVRKGAPDNGAPPIEVMFNLNLVYI